MYKKSNNTSASEDIMRYWNRLFVAWMCFCLLGNVYCIFWWLSVTYSPHIFCIWYCLFYHSEEEEEEDDDDDDDDEELDEEEKERSGGIFSKVISGDDEEGHIEEVCVTVIFYHCCVFILLILKFRTVLEALSKLYYCAFGVCLIRYTDSLNLGQTVAKSFFIFLLF